MDHSSVFVGMDYHMNSVQVCVLDQAGRVLVNRSVANDWQAIVSAVPANCTVQAALEACTGSANLAEQLIDLVGWSVHLAHAGYVHKLKQSPDKTDFSDARLLADLLRVGYLPRSWLAPRAIRELRLAVRYRQQLADARRATKLRIGAVLRDQRIKAPREVGSRWRLAWMRWLREDAPLSEQGRWVVTQHLIQLDAQIQMIRQAETQLRKLTANDAVVHRLMALRGVGLISATYLRSEVGEFDRFRSGKQLSRFCGLSPRNVSSGARQADGGLINACNRRLRTVLVEATQLIVRHDPRWGRLFGQLRDRGKPHNVAIGAVANRWARWLHHHMQAA
jgi:transposase